MKPRKPIRKISAKRLAKLGGKLPFSTIQPRKEPRRWKRRVRLYGDDWLRLVQLVFIRAHQSMRLNDGSILPIPICERRLDDDCAVIAWRGDPSHIKSRGAGGDDVIENLLWSCRSCHSKSHNANGKPCPPKSRMNH